MLNSWQARPLPARPSIERYRKLAKQLVKAAASDSIGEWAARYASRPIEEFAREKLAESGPKLTAAQFVIARSHGFESWPKFQKHVAALAKKGSSVERFEAAADAVVNGKIGVLKRLLREDPDLIRARSTREHQAMLLHYVAANGVEQYRQKTPKNIVRITGILLAAGAEINATAELVRRRSHHARPGRDQRASQARRRAGAADSASARSRRHHRRYGARLSLERPGRSGGVSGGTRSAVDARISRGRGKAGRGRELFQGRRDGAETGVARRILLACAWGRAKVVEFLLDHGADPAWCRKDGQTALHWAVIGGNLEIVKILLRRNPPLEAVNMHGGTVLGEPSGPPRTGATRMRISPSWNNWSPRALGFPRSTCR